MASFAYSLADQDFRTSKSLGILNVSVGLLRQLSVHDGTDKITLLANKSWDALQLEEGVKKVEIAGVASSRLKRIFWDQSGVYRAAARTGHPWLVLPKGFLSFLRRPPVSVAAYVHDVMFDHYDRCYPGDVPRMEQSYFRAGFAAMLRHASAIVTNSRFTADEVNRMAEQYKIKPPSVTHVGIGFESAGAERKVSAAPESILVLISRFPHKKTRMVIEFLDRWWRASDIKPPVLFVGSMPAGCRIPEHAGWEHRERVPDEEYQALRRAARVLVYASDYEGFGMPPMEALDVGVCPVYSDIPAAVEVMEGAGFAFENDRFESFENALSEAWRTDASQIESWKKRVTEKHTWKQVADRFLQALANAG